jgi:hypothetical protein
VQQPVAIKRSQTVGFTSVAPNPGLAGRTYKPTATASSGLKVTITLDGASTGCTYSAATGLVTFTGAGTCRIDANQPGTAAYLPATQVQQAITVKLTQTIHFTSTAPFPRTIGGTYAPSATATSGLTVTFGRGAASTACTVSGGVVTFTGHGTCIVTANQPGSATYAAAPQVQQTITL